MIITSNFFIHLDEEWVNKSSITEGITNSFNQDIKNSDIGKNKIKSDDSDIDDLDKLIRNSLNYTGQPVYNQQMHQLNHLYQQMQNQFQPHQQFMPNFPQQPFFPQNFPHQEHMQYFPQQQPEIMQQIPQSPQQQFSSFPFFPPPHMMQNMPSPNFGVQPQRNNISVSLPPFPSFQNSMDSLVQNIDNISLENQLDEDKEVKGESYVVNYESDSYQEDEEFSDLEKDQISKYGTFERMTDKEIDQISSAIKSARISENPTVNNFYYLITKWKNTNSYKLHRPLCDYFPLINRSPSISYFSGCLGRISTGTVRTPRISIVEKNNEETLHPFTFSKEGGVNVGNERKLLFHIEKIFILLIELEDLERSIRYIDGHQLSEFRDKVKSRYNYKGMLTSKAERINSILKMLHVKDSSFSDDSVDRLISSILTITKGAGMMERILRIIDDISLKTVVFRASISYLCDLTIGSLKKENNKLSNLIPIFKSYLEKQNATIIYMYMAAIAKNQKKMASQSHIFVRSKFGMRVLYCIIKRAIQIIEEKSLPEKLVKQFHLVCLQFFKFIYDIFIQAFNVVSGALINIKDDDKIYARYEDLTSILKEVCSYLIKEPSTNNDAYKELLIKIEKESGS